MQEQQVYSLRDNVASLDYLHVCRFRVFWEQRHHHSGEDFLENQDNLLYHLELLKTFREVKRLSSAYLDILVAKL